MKSLRVAVPPLVVVPLTIVLIVPMMVAALIKLLIPIRPLRRWCRQFVTWIARIWVKVVVSLTRTCYQTRIEVEGNLQTRQDRSYLLISNHASWVDILVILHVFEGRVPFYRFFLKKALLWLPLIGQACWALEFPFMNRHSREYLERHPQKRGEDLAEARRACNRILGQPATIVVFPEGRVFRHELHRHQRSPFRKLLRPRAGGTSLIISAMADQLDGILDVTIHYPDRRPTLWHYLGNAVPSVQVHVRQLDIPSSISNGDYQTDTGFRQRFQAWINNLWREKDQRLRQGGSD